ncbi:MAG TPA: lipoyl(octanoyl) transferase LipB [Pseudomonadales bacterium]|nr:lipoyl(octanoyl) transferase LipB [Pseudomonadales bacterium]
MQTFTATRGHDTPDELWLLEHKPVYTQGQAGKPEHLLSPGNTPVVQTDRGGQITWHGPGQLMIYVLLDACRLNLGARALVNQLENILIAVLDNFGIDAYAKSDAPGVYVLHHGMEAKIAALGLRVKKNGCYHGAALNIDCDLAPFAGINPCGYAGQTVTRLIDCLPQLPSRSDIAQQVIEQFAQALKYD